jgi:hypothetical protein
MEMGMRLTAFAILLCADLTMAPGGVHAQDAAKPHRPALIRPLAWMDLTPRKPIVRPYHAVAPQDANQPAPTAVSYRIAGDGPVGSIGFVRLSASHAIDPSWMSNALASQRGAPSQTVGAQLAYNFR